MSGNCPTQLGLGDSEMGPGHPARPCYSPVGHNNLTKINIRQGYSETMKK